MKKYLVLLVLFLILGCISKEIPKETRNESKIEVSKEKSELEIMEKKPNETLEEKKPLTLLIKQATSTHITSEKIFAGDLVEVISQDESGKWIPFTKINIERPEGLEYERMTNEFGITKLKLVKEGDYKIKTFKEGYKNHTTIINVEKFPPDDLMDYPLYTGEYAKLESDWIEEEFFIGMHTEGAYTNPTFLISSPMIEQGGRHYPVDIREESSNRLVPNFWNSTKEDVVWDFKNMKVDYVDTEHGPMIRIRINGTTEFDNEFNYACDIKVPKDNKYPDLYPYIRCNNANEDLRGYWRYEVGVDQLKESLISVAYGIKYARTPLIDVAYDYKNSETIKDKEHPTYGKLAATFAWENFKPNLNSTESVELGEPLRFVYEYEDAYGRDLKCT